MIANYHSHTWRCNHAKGTEREYVEEAIKGGYKIFGFSDHTPYPADGDFVSPNRMTMAQLEDYCKTVEQLRDEYKNDIEIHLGLETEIFPRYWDRLLDFLKDYPIEYMIQGQHFVGNEQDGHISGRPFKDEFLLKGYVQLVEMGIESGKFLYVAHPDLIRFNGDTEIYDKWMRRMIRSCKAAGMPLEINFLGLWSGRHYPNPHFWELVGEEQADVVFGSDCHRPNTVWNDIALEGAQEMVRKNNLHVLEKLEMPEKLF